MKQRKYFLKKRLSKLKSCTSKDWFNQLQSKPNILFKSNGIYCSCHFCNGIRKRKNQSWNKAFHIKKAEVHLKFMKEELSDY